MIYLKDRLRMTAVYAETRTVWGDKHEIDGKAQT